jgi:predicted TIM-barrel fold metal-dependent hydrolase
VPAELEAAADALERIWRANVGASLPSGGGLVDVHAHLGEDASDGSRLDLRGLLASMAAGGVTRTCAFPFQSPPGAGYAAANAEVLSAAAASGGRVTPFCRSEPGERFRDELTAALDAGAHGIKLHTSLPGFDFSHPQLDDAFALAAERRVPILIHGGRGLPPIADHLAALVRRYTGTRLIIAHAGIADMAALAGHFGGVPGVYFDTSVWSAVDLLDLLRQVAPEQVLFATDYPYGRLPNALLLVLRVTRLSGLDEKQIRGVLGATAAGIAAGEPPPELSAPRGITTLVQPLTFARISQYVSMATPLLWMRQPDAAGGLGLAVNAALEEHAHVEEAEMIREALVTASELWSAVPEVADEAERRRVGDHAKWLVHIAGILAATTHG